MEVDRKSFAASPRSKARVPPSSEERADALEEAMMKGLAKPAVRRGAGVLFGGLTPGGLPLDLAALAPMPPKPTIVDFFKLRFMPHTVTHMLQSANDAQKKGESEETVLACLLHDIAVNLIKVDHGWWAAQMVEPYVSEKVSWAIRHHRRCGSFRTPRWDTGTRNATSRSSAKAMCPSPTSRRRTRRRASTSGTWRRA